MKKIGIPPLPIGQFLPEDPSGRIGDDFYITDNIYPYLRYYPNRLEFYALAICLGGSYRTRINLREYTLKAGSFTVFRPYQVLDLQEINDYKGQLIVFSRSFLSGDPDFHAEAFRFFQEDAVSSVAFSRREMKTVKVYFDLLQEKAMQADNPSRKAIVRNLLLALLHELDVLYRNIYHSEMKKLSRKEELVFSFHDQLAKYFKEERSVQFYADSLFISPKYLSELLKDVTGKNASQLIEDMVAQEAKMLLKNTSYPVSQVATLLHFSDSAAFIKFFKKHSPLSPMQYRKLELA